ncbi:LysE family translocator [Acinetobacter sp. ME22]|uniref:LysE family translocator n=1 Tax=Acinetobacter sp. ME22 TaxID=2904802 RepID=UPI001EDBA315|nr:LysE family translocator [Acinetobacter sp. ME22]MCG2573161.1 LysE family translocator [Acinetobacter sp. ME22]
MHFLELILYATTVIVMIAIPGPVMLLVASAGLKGGYAAALRTIFGTNFASLILIALSVLILKGLLSIEPWIFLSIKIAGCAYIAYLGYEILRDLYRGQDETMQQLKPVDGGFKKGLMVGLSNPKDIIFFSSFFPQFIHVHDNINISLLILIVTWIILDFLTLSIVYHVFNLISKSSIYHKILATCGVLLISIAIYGIATAGISI